MNLEARVTNHETLRVPVDELRTVVRRALIRHGAREAEADRVTYALVAADMRGQHSHGVMRLSTICGRLNAGLIRPGVEPRVERAAAGLLVVDGRHGFGHVVAWEVMERVLSLADEVGIGMAVVSRNNHIGMLGSYAEEAAWSGNIMLVMTTSEAMVRPYGGKDSLLGTNPICIGIPADPRPFVLDMSTSETAIGKLIERQARDQAIPRNWAVDANGHATADPTEALAGAINPFGGAKGYGLGLAVSLLAGVLSGAAQDPEVVGTLDVENLCNKGDLFLAISPAHLLNDDRLVERTSAYLERLRSSPPAPGSDAVMIPGDRGAVAAESATVEGVPIAPSVWETVQALS